MNLSPLLPLYANTPHPLSILNHSKEPWAVSIAVILAGHCTDKAVNKVLPGFLAAFPTPQSLLQNPNKDRMVELLPGISHSGNKSDYILGVAKHLTENNGNFENSIEAITKINGIGRKTGSIVLHYCYGNTEGFPLDTHALRVLKRLGWYNTNNPKSLEKALLKDYAPELRQPTHMALTLHGRTVCTASKPNCQACPLKPACKEGSTLPTTAASHVE